MAEMTINELAEVVEMTPRNIRAYQSRGLLPPPRMRGRVAYYNGVHQARLELVCWLQQEGFSLSAIKRMLDSPTAYAAIVADRRDQRRADPQTLPASVEISAERLEEIFPGIRPALSAAGLVWRDDTGGLHARAPLVAVGRTLQSFGVPGDVVAGLVAQAARAGRRAGERFGDDLNAPATDTDPTDLARVAMQLSATAFEQAFAQATG